MAPKKKVKKADDKAQDGATAIKTAESVITKQFGEGALVFLSDYEEKELEVIPTGSISLDSALGVGGLTKRKMVEVFGVPGCGKTTIAISTAVQAQKMNENEKVIFVDVEKSFSKELALSMGLDEKRTVILSLPTAEQNLAAAEILIKTGEFGMCIIDSVAALTPEVEFQASIEDQQMGLHARLMSKMCRKIKPVIYDTNTMLFLINQTRSKIGGYGNPETTTGGAAIPFYSDIRIKVSGGTSKAERIKAGDKEGEVVGHKMKFAVVKNKLSAPYKEGSVDLIYGAGFDNLGEMVDVGGEVGLIEQKGAWLMYDEVKFQGRARFREALIADPALYESLWADIKRILYR